jgi:hypothetical protein
MMGVMPRSAGLELSVGDQEPYVCYPSKNRQAALVISGASEGFGEGVF